MTDAELLTLLMQLQDGGLTQEQTAKLLGMTQPGVNRVLSGKSKLSSTGRAFVLYLLQEVKVNAAPKRPIPQAAEWAKTLYRLAREIEELEQLPPEYASDAYVMADVG